MPNWEAINAKQALDRELVTLANASLADFLSGIVLDRNAPLIKDVLTDFMVENIQAYGQASSSISAEFYDATRDVPTGSPAYRAIVAPIVPEEQIRKSTSWAVKPLYQDVANTFKTVRNLEGLVDRLIKQQGRDTLSINAASDPVRTRYARILSGPRNCYFCVMLASRGAVYRTKELALRKSGSMDRYHPFCDCVAVAVRSKDDFPDGYDLEELYRQYENPAETTNTFRQAEPPPNQWIDAGDPTAKKYGRDATDRAEKILEIARPKEQAITERLQEIARRNGGEMYNLDFRLKTRDSLARKLKNEFDQL